MFFFTSSRRLKEKEMGFIAIFTLASAVLASLLGIAQTFGITATPVDLGYESYRAYSTFGNPILFAGYLALIVPLGLALALESRGWRRFIFVASSLVLFGALLATLSRGGILGALVSAAVLFFGHLMQLKKAKGGYPRKLPALLLACAAAFIVALTAIAHVNPKFAARFEPTALFEGGAKTRLLTYEVALSSIAERPLTGYGPESFETVFMRDRTDRYVESEGIRSVNDRAHNIALDLLVDGGILLLVAFIALVAMSIISLPKAAKHPLLFALGAGSIGYLVSLLFSFSTAGATAPFFAFLAIISGNTKQPSEIRLRNPNLLRFISIAMSALCALLMFACSTYVASAYYYKRGSVLQRQGDYFKAIERFETATSLFPWESKYFEALGRARANLAAAGTKDDSVLFASYEAYERAVELNPTNRDALFYHALFDISFFSGDPVYVREAISLLERDLALDPYALWARAVLADALDLAGERGRARAEREQAISMALRIGAEKDPFVANALRRAAQKLIAYERSSETAERFLKLTRGKLPRDKEKTAPLDR